MEKTRELEIALGAALLVAGILLLSAGRMLMPPRAPTDACREARTEAWEAGALAVVNYDMRAEGLPAWRSWKEFQADVESSKSKRIALDSFLADMDKSRAEAAAAGGAVPPITRPFKGER